MPFHSSKLSLFNLLFLVLHLGRSLQITKHFQLDTDVPTDQQTLNPNLIFVFPNISCDLLNSSDQLFLVHLIIVFDSLDKLDLFLITILSLAHSNHHQTEILVNQILVFPSSMECYYLYRIEHSSHHYQLLFISILLDLSDPISEFLKVLLSLDILDELVKLLSFIKVLFQTIKTSKLDRQIDVLLHSGITAELILLFLIVLFQFQEIN